MRTCLISALIASALLIALPAQGGEEAEEDAFFARAQQLEKSGNYEKAIDAYELVIREWGLDGRFAVKCHLHIAACLANLKRTKDAIHVLEVAKDRYGESGEAREAIDRSLQKLWRTLGCEDCEDDGEWERRLEELERKLKEKGLEGEELEKAYHRARRQMEEAREARVRAEAARENAEGSREKLEAKLEKMIELWSESGVPPGEILDRVERLRMQQERLEIGRREIEKLAHRLKEQGLPEEEVHRRIGEHERRLAEEREDAWRGRREEEMEGVRREFLHLAERLGIPVHKAERLLEEHARRHEPGHSDQPFHGEGPAAGHIARKVEAMQDFMFRLNKALESFEERLKRLEHRLGRLEEK